MCKYITWQSLANWFIESCDVDSGDVVTHLKLHKLMYYAQAWHLANTDEPLIDEEFEAWAHGPVCTAAYHHFKGINWSQHLAKIDNAPAINSGEIKGFLSLVDKEYGQFSAKALEKKTHIEHPWQTARGNLLPHDRCNEVISKESMQMFYGKELQRNQTV